MLGITSLCLIANLYRCKTTLEIINSYVDEKQKDMLSPICIGCNVNLNFFRIQQLSRQGLSKRKRRLRGK